MFKETLRRLQEEASFAYGKVPQSEGAAWAQVMVQVEIALQLAKLNETLADIGKDMSALNLSDLEQ